jgi:hypothetical protein
MLVHGASLFCLLQVDKYVFPPTGSTGILVTPSHKLGHTFKFKVIHSKELVYSV